MKTLIVLFWESTRTVRFVMMLVSFLGAAGIFMRGATPSGDMHLLFNKSPWWVWSGILLVVTVNRWWCLWYGRRCTDVCASTESAIIVGVFAMFVWVMLLVSASVASDFGLALMMAVCVVCEFWLLARVFAEKYFK